MVQFRDISAEEAVRQQLRRYEARLREFMQDLDEGIAVVTPHGGVQFISESGRRVLGLAPDEALGEVLDYCSEADRDRLVAQLRDAPSRIRPRRSATGLCGTTARRAGCASCAGRSRSRTISSGCSCSSAT